MSDTTKTREPVALVNGLLMTLHTFFAGGAAVSAFIDDNASLAALFAFGNLATVALQAGLTAYLRGVVVPVESVVERVNGDGMVVAGPANTIVEEGKTVRPAEVEAWAVAPQDLDPAAPEGEHDALPPGRHAQEVQDGTR